VKNVYDFKVKLANSTEKSLREYEGKPLIIVNTDNIKETTDFCQLNYGVTFPIFAKIDVGLPDVEKSAMLYHLRNIG
jgi:glutathione peroxidase